MLHVSDLVDLTSAAEAARPVPAAAAASAIERARQVLLVAHEAGHPTLANVLATHRQLFDGDVDADALLNTAVYQLLIELSMVPVAGDWFSKLEYVGEVADADAGAGGSSSPRPPPPPPDVPHPLLLWAAEHWIATSFPRRRVALPPQLAASASGGRELSAWARRFPALGKVSLRGDATDMRDWWSGDVTARVSSSSASSASSSLSSSSSTAYHSKWEITASAGVRLFLAAHVAGERWQKGRAFRGWQKRAATAQLCRSRAYDMRARGHVRLLMRALGAWRTWTVRRAGIRTLTQRRYLRRWSRWRHTLHLRVPFEGWCSVHKREHWRRLAFDHWTGRAFARQCRRAVAKLRAHAAGLNRRARLFYTKLWFDRWADRWEYSAYRRAYFASTIGRAARLRRFQILAGAFNDWQHALLTRKRTREACIEVDEVVRRVLCGRAFGRLFDWYMLCLHREHAARLNGGATNARYDQFADAFQARDRLAEMQRTRTARRALYRWRRFTDAARTERRLSGSAARHRRRRLLSWGFRDGFLTVLLTARRTRLQELVAAYFCEQRALHKRFGAWRRRTKESTQLES